MINPLLTLAKLTAVAGITLALTACGNGNDPILEPAIQWQPDQELRAKLFDSCMKALPAGPSSTQYNDWSEVVDSCADIAYRQSLRQSRRNADGKWVPI